MGYYCPESPIIGCREEYYEAYNPHYPNLTGDSWKLRCGFGEDEKLHGTFIQRREVNGDRVETYKLRYYAYKTDTENIYDSDLYHIEANQSDGWKFETIMYQNQ